MTALLSATLLQASGEILLLLDPAQLTVTAASPAACRLLGYEEAALIGRTILDLECDPGAIFFWDEVRHGESAEIRDVDVRYRCRDGRLLETVRSVLAVAAPLPALVVRALPVDKLRAAEDELAQMTARLQATLEATHDGILLVDREGQPVKMNHAFARLWRVPATVFDHANNITLDQHLASQMPDPAAYRTRLALIGNADEGDSFDVLTLSDGRVFERSSQPARLGPRIIGRVFTFTDVSERQRAAEALAAARDRADAAARAKGQFLAMMSHEIRTPMNGIIGMAQLLDLTRLDGEQSEFVRSIRGSGEALLTIINDILDYSRMEARMLHLQEELFVLPALLKAIEPLFLMRIRDGSVRYQVEVAPDVPQQLIGDGPRLRQILINLLGNAFKFTPSGQITLSIRLAPAADDDRVVLQFAVTDTGIGIAAEHLVRLFTPFEQGDASTTRRFGGTGLGLSICKMLTELMGGSIGVSSEPGHGSTFRFTACFGQPKSGRPVTASGAPAQILRGNTRILVAEDVATNRLLITSMLKRLGVANVDCVENGLQVLAQVAEKTYDLIFMDVQMPDMDGVEATGHLRSLGCGAYVIGISADALEGGRQGALAMGFNDYLTKPLLLDDLQQAILRWREGLRSQAT